MKTILILSATALLLAPAAGLAKPTTASLDRPVESSARVAYGDLDLTTPSGAHTLLDRLNRAGGKVCGARALDPGYDLQTLLRVKACRRAAVGRAVDRLDAPLVTAAFRPHQSVAPMLQARR